MVDDNNDPKGYKDYRAGIAAELRKQGFKPVDRIKGNRSSIQVWARG